MNIKNSEKNRLLNPLTKTDQLPFLSRNKFNISSITENVKNYQPLSFIFAVLCIIDLFGVFPIITLPRAIIRCGYYGIPLGLFVILLQTYTATILGKCWIIAEKLDPTIILKNRYPYAAIAEMTYGKCMSFIVTLLIDLIVFGGGIPNLLVASQNLQLLGHRISGGEFYFSFCYWLLFTGTLMCPLMWLESPKNMRVVSIVSVITVSTVCVLTSYSIFNYNEEKMVEENYESTFLDIITAYGLMAFQFNIHPLLLTIQVDMKNKHKIGKAVYCGIAITGTMSVISTVLCAYKFGTNVPRNILEIFPKSVTLYTIILLVTLQLILSSAVGTSALFQQIENLIGLSREFSIKRCIIRSTLIAFEVIIAEILPRFDIIMAMIGGSLTGPLIFIIPPLIYIKLNKMQTIYDTERVTPDSSVTTPIGKNEGLSRNEYENINDIIINGDSAVNSKFVISLKKFCKILYSHRVLLISVIIFGLCLTLTSTYFNFYKLSELMEFRSPCLGNISYSFEDL